MKKIAIYGLGNNFTKYRLIFTSESCVGGKIVAYSDKDEKNINLFVTPEKLHDLDVDVIIVTCDSYEDVINELNDERAIYYIDYFFSEWNVDRRAVKFLENSFIDDLAIIKKHIRKIKNFIEIGANFAQDAVLVKKVFDIKDCDVYIFEPHPQIMAAIKDRYGFNCYEVAISDHSGTADFYMCNIDKLVNNGMSSLKESSELYDDRYECIEVNISRIDDMINKRELPEVMDFVKIDVEGNTLEVLKGFGDSLNGVKVIQCEGDYHSFWDGEKLFNEIFNNLWQNGFRMVNFHITDDFRETDSLWFNTTTL